MKLPKFPPDLSEWKPGEPFKESPLPKWLSDNPGVLPEALTQKDYQEVVGKYGLWATKRALAFVPKTATRADVEKVAESLYRSALPI